GREVLVEHDLSVADPRYRGHRVVGVRDHEEGEVGRTEVRRQAQPHLRVAGRRDGARGDEAEPGDRLVQLRVAHRPQRGEYRAVVAAHADGDSAVTATESSRAAGVPCAGASRHSAGTSMSYSFAALRPS